MKDLQVRPVACSREGSACIQGEDRWVFGLDEFKGKFTPSVVPVSHSSTKERLYVGDHVTVGSDGLVRKAKRGEALIGQVARRFGVAPLTALRMSGRQIPSGTLYVFDEQRILL